MAGLAAKMPAAASCGVGVWDVPEVNEELLGVPPTLEKGQLPEGL